MNYRSVPAAIGCSIAASLVSLCVLFRYLSAFSFWPLLFPSNSIGFSHSAQGYTVIVCLLLSVAYAALLSQGRVVVSAVVAVLISLAAAGLSVSGYVGIPVLASALLAVALVAAMFFLLERQVSPAELGIAGISGVFSGCLAVFLLMSSTSAHMERLPEDGFQTRQITNAEWLQWDANTTKAWVVSIVRAEEAALQFPEGSPVYAAALPMSLAATYQDGAILVNKAMLYVKKPSYKEVQGFEWQEWASGQPEPYKFQRGVGPNALAVGACHAVALEAVMRGQEDQSYWKGWKQVPKTLPEGEDHPQSEDPVYKATWDRGLSRYVQYVQTTGLTTSK